MHDSRRIPLGQLVRRLGLGRYDLPAPYAAVEVHPSRVRLPLRQHIGTPAEPVVAEGDRVEEGDLIAEIPEGQLGARVHASIAGVVHHVGEEIVIQAG